MTAVGGGVILGAGNPLLDVIAHVDKEFLDRWGLKENNSTPCTGELEGVFKEIEALTPVMVPGGIVQNTAVVFQWILRSTDYRFTVLGTVGDDPAGSILTRKMLQSGVDVHYETTSSAPTGKCAVLINGHHRSMCTMLGASKMFSVGILDNPRVKPLIATAQYFYFSCQFFNACGAFLQKMARYCGETSKVLCVNLGSPLAQRRFAEEVKGLVPYVDVFFGNNEETAAFGEAQGISGSVKDIAREMTRLPKATERGRIVVVTQARDPIILAQKGQMEELNIVQVAEEKILDTNGAGDAFVGGFLSQFVQGKDAKLCVECGNYAASEIIQSVGCSPPEHCHWNQ